MTKEIAILGAGVAGLVTASKLEELGHKTTIFTKSGTASTHYRSVYTTFQGRTATFKTYFSPDTLLPLESFHVETEKSSIHLNSNGYTMIDYPRAIRELRKRTSSSNFEELSRNTRIEVVDGKDSATLRIDGESKIFDSVVDCTGKDAITSKDENPLVEFLYGAVYRGSLPKPEMLIAYVNEIGCTCWINPSVIPGYIDLVVNAWGWKNDTGKFIQSGQSRMKVLIDFLQRKNLVALEKKQSETRFIGAIVSQVGKRPSTKHLYAAGESAKMAIPKTGDSFRWAILGGEIVAEAISSSESPAQAYDNFYEHRPKWRDYLLEGSTLHRLARQEKGTLDESVDIMDKILTEKPNLKNFVEEFFIQGSLHPKLLLQVLTQSHFRELLAGSMIKELIRFTVGLERVEPYYALPQNNVKRYSSEGDQGVN